jgi:hypothetical protein
LYTIPPFTNIAKYHKLDLRYNYIAFLPKNILEKFTIVDIRNNPSFNCESFFQTFTSAERHRILSSCPEEKAESFKFTTPNLQMFLSYLWRDNVTTDSYNISAASITGNGTISYQFEATYKLGNISTSAYFTLSGLALGISLFTLSILLRKNIKNILTKCQRRCRADNFSFQFEELQNLNFSSTSLNSPDFDEDNLEFLHPDAARVKFE